MKRPLCTPLLPCLLSLFIFVSAQVQPMADEPKKVSSLDDAQTADDVVAYITRYEIEHMNASGDPKERAVQFADMLLSARDKILEFCNGSDFDYTYSLKFTALATLANADIEGAEQKLETFFNELESNDKTKSLALAHRFQWFVSTSMPDRTRKSFDKFKTELKQTWLNIPESPVLNCVPQVLQIAERHKVPAEQIIKELVEYVRSKECTLSDSAKEETVKQIEQRAVRYQFAQFGARVMREEKSPKNFDKFKSELKTWINQKTMLAYNFAKLGLNVAERYEVPAEQFIKEMVEYIRSPECPLAATDKQIAVEAFEKELRLIVGSDPKLYGKTLDDQDFSWANLRDKYVLIKFTGTWCGPCMGQIPGMLEAYEKYHDKGLEIVSVYVWEKGSPQEQVETVKKFVAKEKLPWIILSETLTDGAGQEKYGVFYSIYSVPTMVLVDKEGKIIMTEANGSKLQTKLAEIFK